ncbi:MAG TPA: hypothetical protein VGF44_15345 [Terriglobales bacterium]
MARSLGTPPRTAEGSRTGCNSLPGSHSGKITARHGAYRRRPLPGTHVILA